MCHYHGIEMYAIVVLSPLLPARVGQYNCMLWQTYHRMVTARVELLDEFKVDPTDVLT